MTPLAVLTGDLIGSTRLPAETLDAAFAALSVLAHEAGRWQGADLRFTRSRGDGWQMCLVRPALALRTALAARASLRAADRRLATRIAIAEGIGDPGTGDLNTAAGPVFEASGRALDRLDGASMIHAAAGATGAAVRLADEISHGWTQAQAAAMVLFLAPDPPTRAVAGSMLGKSRQAVDQALAAAAFPAISQALDMIEGAEA